MTVKVLICGVPYGCDNVGDEAILASIVKHLRNLKDGLEIAVVTGKPQETENKLHVKGIPLIPHPETKAPMWTPEIREACRWADVYIHGGATGIHDYPMHMLTGLRMAKEEGCKTVVYGAGGGPYNHKFYEGRKTKLLRLASKATLGLVNFRAMAERIVTSKYRKAIAAGLGAVDLLIVRDVETRQTLAGYGMDPSRIYVSGDSAFALDPAPQEAADKIAEDADLRRDGKAVVGVGISSQKKVVDLLAVTKLCDDIIEKYGAHVLFIPMNPYMDDAVHLEVIAGMRHGKETKRITRYTEPEDLLAFMPRLHTVISSRLHLIILAAIAGVPPVGIDRGSGKITSFMKRFGLEAAGEYFAVNYDTLSARFADVWKRHDELQRVIKSEMAKARQTFKEESRRILPLLESVKPRD